MRQVRKITLDWWNKLTDKRKELFVNKYDSLNIEYIYKQEHKDEPT